MTLELRLLPAVFAVCRLPPDAPSPERFWSLTRTDEELSVICTEDAVPERAAVQRGWRGSPARSTSRSPAWRPR